MPPDLMVDGWLVGVFHCFVWFGFFATTVQSPFHEQVLLAKKTNTHTHIRLNSLSQQVAATYKPYKDKTTLTQCKVTHKRGPQTNKQTDLNLTLLAKSKKKKTTQNHETFFIILRHSLSQSVVEAAAVCLTKPMEQKNTGVHVSF